MEEGRVAERENKVCHIAILNCQTKTKLDSVLWNDT